MCLCGSQEYVRGLQSSLWSSHSLNFHSTFWWDCSLTQLVWKPQAIVMLNNCCWFLYTIFLGAGLLSPYELPLVWNNNKPCELSFFRELKALPSSDAYPQVGTLGHVKTICPLLELSCCCFSGLFWLLDYLLIFKAAWELGRGNWE